MEYSLHIGALTKNKILKTENDFFFIFGQFYTNTDKN